HARQNNPPVNHRPRRWRTRRTCIGNHWPPFGAAMPRALRSIAIHGRSSLATPEREHGDVSLLLLDAGVADHPSPALRLFLLELRHVRRAAATGQNMQLPVSFLDLRLVERRVNGPVELGNYGSRCFRWRVDGCPGTREDPGAPRFDHGGNVGQLVEPTLGCAREDPGLSPGVELVGWQVP